MASSQDRPPLCTRARVLEIHDQGPGHITVVECSVLHKAKKAQCNPQMQQIFKKHADATQVTFDFHRNGPSEADCMERGYVHIPYG